MSRSDATEGEFPPPVVVKLGGSLLDLPDLCDRLVTVVEQLRPSPVLIVVGGGAAADTIRRLDELCSLTANAAHWWAIDAMTFNARLVARLDRRFRVVSDRRGAAAAWLADTLPVIDAATFLRNEQDRLSVATRQLPESWDVTSDSIAAWIGRVWPASELVLAKSCARPCSSSEGVDASFSGETCGLRVAWVNMRKSPLIVERFGD